MQLRGDHFSQLHSDLAGAFNRGDLERFVRVHFNADLDHIAGSGPLNEVMAELIHWAERHGQLDDLVAHAAAERPENPAIQQLAVDFPAWQKQVLVAGDEVPPPDLAPERTARPGGLTPALGILLLVAAAAVVLAVWQPWAPKLPATLPQALPAAVVQPKSTATPPTSTPTATAPAAILPFATARPDEYLIVVAEFYPSLAQFPQFDALDALVSTLQDAFGASSAAHWRIEEYVEPIMDAEQARSVGASAQAQVVIWGRVSSGRLRINITSQRPTADGMAVRLDPSLAQPQESFFNVYAPERLQSYVAPFVVGQYYLDVGDYARAESSMTEAVSATAAAPLDGAEYAHLLQGNAHYLQGDFSSAITSYNAAVQLNQGLLDAYYNRSLAHLEVGDLAAASDDTELVLSRDPNYSEAYVNRGLILKRQASAEGDAAAKRELWLEAKAAYDQALATLPEGEAGSAFNTFSLRGVIYGDLGELDKARQDFERVVGPDFDCAPVFDSPAAQRQPEKVRDFCANAAYNYAGLFDYSQIDQSNIDALEQLNLLAVNHMSKPDYKAFSYVRLIDVYEFEGRLTEAYAAARQALVGLPDNEALSQYTEDLCSRAAGA